MIAPERVEAEFKTIFDELFEGGDVAICPDLTAADVKGWDSFKHVEIVMAVQDRFDMQFTSKEVDGFTCLGDLMRAVRERGRL